MQTETITISLDTVSAQIYASASAEDQKRMRLLLRLWLREFGASSKPLNVLLDEISEKAQARGLTPEILESLLNERLFRLR